MATVREGPLPLVPMPRPLPLPLLATPSWSTTLLCSNSIRGHPCLYILCIKQHIMHCTLEESVHRKEGGWYEPESICNGGGEAAFPLPSNYSLSDHARKGGLKYYCNYTFNANLSNHFLPLVPVPCPLPLPLPATPLLGPLLLFFAPTALKVTFVSTHFALNNTSCTAH